MTRATVHSRTEIERMLALGLAPITDNERALAELGFARSFPHAKPGGYEASVYERSVDADSYAPRRSGVRLRKAAAQRAFLVPD